LTAIGLAHIQALKAASIELRRHDVFHVEQLEGFMYRSGTKSQIGLEQYTASKSGKTAC
jgi:hypothetical protein